MREDPSQKISRSRSPGCESTQRLYTCLLLKISSVLRSCGNVLSLTENNIFRQIYTINIFHYLEFRQRKLLEYDILLVEQRYHTKSFT